jgi:hypothetical protein
MEEAKYNFVSIDYIYNFIINNNSFFIPRIGGSDYNAVYQYKNAIKLNQNYDYDTYYHICSNYNGYFDKENDIELKKINFFNYLEKIYEIINKYKVISVMGDIYNYKISKFYDENYNKILLENSSLFSYAYIETIKPFLNDFKNFAENKKILIISPFSDSIKYQYNKKNFILKDYIFPNFELLTYTTPITYNDNIEDLLDIKTNNWFEQCEFMCNEINLLDFDYALLSCGSYAYFLGDYINTCMKKKAIYIGGVLNVIFNLGGKRYDSDHYNNMVNLEYRITPIEKNIYSNKKGGNGIVSEGFNAYF